MIIVPLVQNLMVLTGRNITEADIEALESIDLAFEYTRQSGKTTSIVHIVEIILIFVSKLFKLPIEVGIFAPQKEQANTDFKRLKRALARSKQDLIVVDHDANRQAKEESNAKTITLGNGSSCYIFPVSTTSNPESKTLHVIIIEEAQDIDDKIINEEVLPMGAATNAVVVRVGTAGDKYCDLYWAVQKGKAYVMTYPEIAADRRRMYEMTKDPRHLIYEQRVKQEIIKHGLASAAIQRPYYNVWQLQIGQFITAQQLFPCRVDRLYEDPGADPDFREYHTWRRGGRRQLPEIDAWMAQHNIEEQRAAMFRVWTEARHYFGLDTAKKADQTVLKIGRMIDGKLTVVRSVQGMRGLNYEDQFKDVLKPELAWFKVGAGAIDSTGQGDFMPDMFERNTGYQIYRVTFSLQSKDIMYKGLYNKIVNGKFAYHWQDPEVYAARSLTPGIPMTPQQYTAKASDEFEDEMIKLETDYVGEKMKIHHPETASDGREPHDDHPDATALMSYAFDSYEGPVGITDYMKRQAAEREAAKEES